VGLTAGLGVLEKSEISCPVKIPQPAHNLNTVLIAILSLKLRCSIAFLSIFHIYLLILCEYYVCKALLWKVI
jgi:hypothetical protein